MRRGVRFRFWQWRNAIEVSADAAPIDWWYLWMPENRAWLRRNWRKFALGFAFLLGGLVTLMLAIVVLGLTMHHLYPGLFDWLGRCDPDVSECGSHGVH